MSVLLSRTCCNPYRTFLLWKILGLQKVLYSTHNLHQFRWCWPWSTRCRDVHMSVLLSCKNMLLLIELSCSEKFLGLQKVLYSTHNLHQFRWCWPWSTRCRDVHMSVLLSCKNMLYRTFLLWKFLGLQKVLFSGDKKQIYMGLCLVLALHTSSIDNYGTFSTNMKRAC